LIDQGISEGNKVEIVRLHNELRANLANGQLRGGAASFPPASDMLQLTWDNEVFNIFTIWNVGSNSLIILIEKCLVNFFL
jgi:hypothetical protein